MKLPTSEDIRVLIPDAEKVFLPTGAHFDVESQDFICCLEAKDIVACPGSGKTTALLAKLYILSKFMPFQNNQGICVLTHTNVAINEIKNRMGGAASILFSYPNYFGTIQGFVDRFLAIPAYISDFEKRPTRFDDDFVDSLIERKLSFKTRSWLSNQHINVIKNLRLDDNCNLRLGINGQATSFPLKDKTKETYQNLLKAKLEVFLDGNLKYDEAYWLAECYLSDNPHLPSAFSARFIYSFIDEMQDTTSVQMSILDKLFSTKTIFQRIGDPNQAIYNFARADLDWKRRDDPMYIPSSKRISTSIAHVIRTFCLEPESNLIGVARGIGEIKPQIILFNNPIEVLPKFSEMIRQHENQWQYVQYPVYKAVGWVGKREDGDINKLWIGSYYPEYCRPSKIKKAVFDSLKNYFLKHPDSLKGKQVKPIFDGLMNCFLRTLEIADVKRTIDKDKQIRYTREALFRELYERHHTFYRVFLERTAKWTKSIYSHACSNSCENRALPYPTCVLSEIAAFMKNEWAVTMQFDGQRLIDFIQHDLENIPLNHSDLSNIFKDDGIDVEVGTVHSVKGETHTATLFLETYFNKAHESKRLGQYFAGNHSSPKNDAISSSLKVAYVGLSRPTHLLCVAFQQDHVSDENLSRLEQNGWIVNRTSIIGQ